jgi:pyridoxal phosphate-dependent aminotransferase EpsN
VEHGSALVGVGFGSTRGAGKLPRALIIVDIYGQCANYPELLAIAATYRVPVIEDAAEALGSTCAGRPAGSFGLLSAFSFNGNKIITTSGGGMLVSDEADLIAEARKLATQAREPVPHYEHQTIGYNYRMSNVLAGIGRAQLRALDQRVAARRRIYDRYYEALKGLPGIAFRAEAPWGIATRWLTCLTIDPALAPTDREKVRLALEARTSSRGRSGNRCTCSRCSSGWAARCMAARSRNGCSSRAFAFHPVQG